MKEEKNGKKEIRKEKAVKAETLKKKNSPSALKSAKSSGKMRAKKGKRRAARTGK